MSFELSSSPRPQSSNAQKYQSRNPVVQRLLGRFKDRITTFVALFAPQSIIDLGAGEGLMAAELTRRLDFSFRYRGIELEPSAVEVARAALPQLDFRVGDIVTMKPERDAVDLALCLEVLEHLPAPELALANIAAWTSRHAIVSVPWEPYFRLGNFARGQHLRTWGNHPEHVQHFTPRTLRAFVAREFHTVHVETCFPWLIAVGRK